MRTTRLSQVIHGKQVMMTAIIIAFVGATLWVAPPTKAWSTFSVWYGNRTSNSVTIYWTVRGQEDSLSTPADAAHICWTTDPTAYPCPSHETTTGQYVPVGTTMSYTINGLTCAAYRVMVGQSYVLSQTWDWDEHTIDVASQCSNLALSAVASASSTYPSDSYAAAHVNDGSRDTTVGGTSSWVNAAQYAPNGSLPQWVQLDFGVNKTFSRVDLYTSAGYPIQNYQIQIWNGTTWVDVVTPVTGNTALTRTHSFPPQTSRLVRILGTRGPSIQPQYVRVNEFEVY